MPLLKRKPFTLNEPPKDLQPNEPVYQIRFTKEIFQDYQEYLKRINLYRQKIWMCKSTAKSNLTYEEALVSEKHASEKVQDLPDELLAPALSIIQFSMLSLKDLTNSIAAKLQDCFFVGAELCGRKGDSTPPCRIVKIHGEQYEVAWVDKNKETEETAMVRKQELIWKKPPFTRSTLKSFIRESTYRNIPWVLHENLARSHGISTELPAELKDKFCFEGGMLVYKKKKRKNDGDSNGVGDVNGESRRCKQKNHDSKNSGGSTMEDDAGKEEDKPQEEPIKYPIDDLLVQPGADDPIFTDRPILSKDFSVPMDCVGDLLMVWDFCTSFGRLLHLCPFSLEDFENAICHKDSNSVLIMESHSAFFRLLIKEKSEYASSIQAKKRKSKITLLNWMEYVCDFLEMINIPELSTHIPTIRRGHYNLLDANVKIGILRELVDQVIETDAFREKMDEHIEQRHELGATRREEALEDARKKREDKERLKAAAESNGVIENQQNGNHSPQTGDIADQRDGEVVLSQQGNKTKNGEKKHMDSTSSTMSKKTNTDETVVVENGTHSSKEAPKQLDGTNEPAGKRSKEQRKDYFEREMEKRFVRTNSLGKDRHYNRYWWFQRDGRLFVESSDLKQWGYYSTKEELDALMGSLNIKGERERALKKQLEKFYGKISSALQKRSKDLALRIALEEAVLRRSTRVRAAPGENPASAFLKYVNKWKEE